MEIIEAESQMTVLQDTLAEEEMNDEEEDLNNRSETPDEFMLFDMKTTDT